MQRNRLRELREKFGMSAVDLEHEVGIRASSISLQENMKRGITIETAVKYCDFFQVSLDFFFCREAYSTVFEKYKTSELEEFLEILEKEIKTRKK